MFDLMQYALIFYDFQLILARMWWRRVYPRPAAHGRPGAGYRPGMGDTGRTGGR